MRIFQDENIGKLTFHESRGSSVVDYLLVDVRVWDLMENFAVHDISCYSDHCAIEFSILVRQNSCGNTNDKSYVSVQNDCEIDSFKLIRADKVSRMVSNQLFSDTLVELDRNLKEGTATPKNVLTVLEQISRVTAEDSMKKIRISYEYDKT